MSDDKIIDFQKRRHEKILRSVEQGLEPLGAAFDARLADRDRTHAIAKSEFQQIQNIVNKLRIDSYVPGFTDLDDILHWLTVDKRGTHRNQTALKAEYSPQDVFKLRMIAHHSPRLLSRLNEMKRVVHTFLDKWQKKVVSGEIPADPEAVEQAAYLDSEIANDIHTLDEVRRLFKVEPTKDWRDFV